MRVPTRVYCARRACDLHEGEAQLGDHLRGLVLLSAHQLQDRPQERCLREPRGLKIDGE